MEVNQKKIAWNWKVDWNCGVLSPSALDPSRSIPYAHEITIVCIAATVVASIEPDDNACILIATLTATITLTQRNENENEIIFDSGTVVGFKHIANSINYFSIAVSIILQIRLMMTPINKFLDKSRSISVISMNLDCNEFESEIFLCLFRSKIRSSIVFLIESIGKYCNLNYFYTCIKIIQTSKTQSNIFVLIATTHNSNIMAMNNVKIECISSACNLLIACSIDIKFSKIYHYSLWCGRCSEYETYIIPIKHNFILFMIGISNKLYVLYIINCSTTEYT